MSNTEENLNNTKKIVEDLLANDPRCRENDLWLTIQVWQRAQHVKCFIPYADLDSMISPESISRVRRKIQNDEGKFLPTNPMVLRKRKRRQQEVKQWSIHN